MSAVPPVGRGPLDPAWPSAPIERVGDRWDDDPARHDAEQKRRRRRRRPPEPDEPSGDHVDVRA